MQSGIQPLLVGYEPRFTKNMQCPFWVSLWISKRALFLYCSFQKIINFFYRPETWERCSRVSGFFLFPDFFEGSSVWWKDFKKGTGQSMGDGYKHQMEQRCYSKLNIAPQLNTPGRARCTAASLETEQSRRRGCTLTLPGPHGIIDVS